MANRKYAQVLGEQQREKFTQTEMAGLKNHLEMQFVQEGERYHVRDTDKAI